MKTLLANFLADEGGQDLIEYTLLLAFLALASTALFATAGASTNTIWKGARGVLSNAVIASS